MRTRAIEVSHWETRSGEIPTEWLSIGSLCPIYRHNMPFGEPFRPLHALFVEARWLSHLLVAFGGEER